MSYKKDVQDTHRYTEVLNRPDIKKATEITKIISDVCFPFTLFLFFRHAIFYSNFDQIFLECCWNSQMS